MWPIILFLFYQGSRAIMHVGTSKNRKLDLICWWWWIRTDFIISQLLAWEYEFLDPRQWLFPRYKVHVFNHKKRFNISTGEAAILKRLPDNTMAIKGQNRQTITYVKVCAVIHFTHPEFQTDNVDILFLYLCFVCNQNQLHWVH